MPSLINDSDDTAHQNNSSQSESGNKPSNLSKQPSVEAQEHSPPNDSTPLLNQPNRHYVQTDDSTSNIIPRVRAPAAIITLIMFVVVLTSCGDQLQDSPQTRIFESVICYSHFETHDPSKLLLSRDKIGPGALGGVAEMWCKADAVQSELAELKGYQAFFDGFPSLLLAIPFGWAADRYGRKPIVMLALIAMPLNSAWPQLVTWFWQSFDIRFSWLSSFTGLLGGGNAVVSALVFTMLADVVPQAGRAAVFFRLGAANLVAGLVMPPIAAWLMHYNPWIPCFLALLLQILACLLFTLVPETLNHIPQCPSPEPSPTSHEPSNHTPTTPPETHSQPDKPHVLLRPLTTALQPLNFLTTDHRLPLLILPFTVHLLLTDGVSTTLLQYSSKTYALPLSTATLLLTLRSLALVLLFLLLLPSLSNHCVRKLGLSSQARDLYLARGSAGFMIAGWGCVGAANGIGGFVVGLVASSLGAGMPFLVRSFLVGIVGKGEVARVYSLVSIVDTLGVMLGSPLLAALFEHGMEIGVAGLPFYFLAAVSLAILVDLLIVKMRKGEGHEAEDVDDTEGEHAGRGS